MLKVVKVNRAKRPNFKWIFLGVGLTLLCTFLIFAEKSRSERAHKVAFATKIKALGSLNKKYKGDPQVVAKTLQLYFMQRYSNIHGNQVESVLSALGASAGFGTQMAIREGFIKPGIVPADQAFVILRARNGERYFYGDFLNHGLFESGKRQITVWSLVGGGAQKAGAKTLPDIVEIVKYNASTLGTNAFGIPRLPKGHQPSELPKAVLSQTWPHVQSILKSQNIDPTVWGWTLAMAAQNVIIQNKNKIDPALAAKIVMESALPMSKVDPVSIGIGY